MNSKPHSELLNLLTKFSSLKSKNNLNQKIAFLNLLKETHKVKFAHQNNTRTRLLSVFRTKVNKVSITKQAFINNLILFRLERGVKQHIENYSSFELDL